MRYKALFLLLLPFLCSIRSEVDPRLAGSYRQDKNGWVFVHLQGTPNDIGFQDGYLLAPDIDDAIRTLKYYLAIGTRKSWGWYRANARRMF